MMEFSEKMVEMARTAKTPEELQALAEKNQIVLSEEQAREYFDKLNRSGELSDEELDSVAGGGCGGSSRPPCPRCGSTEVQYRGNPIVTAFCKECGKRLD